MRKLNFLAASLLVATYLTGGATAHVSTNTHTAIAGVIPFTDFDAGNHSYAIGFRIEHLGFHERNYKHTSRAHNPPQVLYQNIIERYSHLGTITPRAS
jgi:hypothetical protein